MIHQLSMHIFSSSSSSSSCEMTQGLEHGEFVRVRTVHLNGKPRVLTLKQDLHYWPTWELRFDADTATWRRTVIKTLA